MKRLLAALLVGASTFGALPTQAATIVQTITGNTGATSGTYLTLFDPALGSLDAVQVQADFSQSITVARGPNDPANTVTSASGSAGLNLAPFYYEFTGDLPLLDLIPFNAVITYGSGSKGVCVASGSGSQTITTGLSAFTGSGTVRIRQTGSGPCERALSQTIIAYTAKVTYDYTPTGSVPEPANWALMILGFGAVGAGLRRRWTVVAFA